MDDSIFISLSYMVHWLFILGQGWLLSNLSKLSLSKFWIVHNAVWMHALLLCCQGFRKCLHAVQTTPTWTKTTLTCFTELIAVQTSMAEYEWTVYQMKVEWLYYPALKSVLLYIFFWFWKFGVNPGFPFFNSHCRKVSEGKQNRTYWNLILIILVVRY